MFFIRFFRFFPLFSMACVSVLLVVAAAILWIFIFLIFFVSEAVSPPKVKQFFQSLGLNRHFKPNMRKIQIAISSDLCITLT